MVMRSQRGFGILEILVSVSILGILISAMVSYQDFQLKAQRRLLQKYEAMELKQNLASTMASVSWGDICTCQLNPANASNPDPSIGPLLRFDATATPDSQTLNIRKIFGSCGTVSPTILISEGAAVPGTQTGLKIRDIKFTKLEPIGSAGNPVWKGVWQVNLDTGSDPSLHPIEITQLFNIAAASPTSTVNECYTAGALGGGVPQLAMRCPANQVMTGLTSQGAICTPLTASSIDTNFSSGAPGPGCIGNGCRTYDYGPCNGSGCFTNGSSCQGGGCTACQPAATCTGLGCCAGVACNGC